MQEVAETRVARKAPSLRFSSFKDNWNEEKIGAGIDLVSGRHLLPDEYNNTGDGVAYFTGPSDLTNDIDHLTKWTKIVGNTGVKGDVLLTVKGSGVGTLLHLELDEAALGRQLMAIKSKRHSTGFLFQRLLLLQPYFEALASGNMIPGLSRPDILTTKVYFPTLPEQQKIAAFLGAVDWKIQHLKREQELLQRYKKGVVQKLFSQELRFKRKDGGEFPEWEEKMLGDGGDIITGKTPLTAEADLWGGDIQFITPTDITENDKYQHTTQRYVQPHEKLKLLPANSIVYTCIASIGKLAMTMHPAITNQQINAVVPREGYSSEFIYYALLYLTPSIKATQANTTLPIINKTEFSKILIPIPSLEEQSRIAGFLMALDAKVAGVAQAVAAAQKWKKGLLQQMFV